MHAWVDKGYVAVEFPSPPSIKRTDHHTSFAHPNTHTQVAPTFLHGWRALLQPLLSQPHQQQGALHGLAHLRRGTSGYGYGFSCRAIVSCLVGVNAYEMNTHLHIHLPIPRPPPNNNFHERPHTHTYTNSIATPEACQALASLITGGLLPVLRTLDLRNAGIAHQVSR